jgi:uncharacterized protein YndB with AHSA1/START domain
MSKRSTVHDTFVIERDFPFEPEFVFSAWTTAESKARWFAGSGAWKIQHRELDFRLGGRESVIGRRGDGHLSKFNARYHEIVPDERIVYVYDMYTDDDHNSTSLATIEFKERAGATQLTITEQGVFFDDCNQARGREHGTGILMDQLQQALARG